jgi:hypothetical protein
MKSNSNLSLQDWENIYRACKGSTSDFLLSAINETLYQKRMPRIEIEAAREVSHEALVEITFQIIRDTDIQDDDSSKVWIDPEGKYRISIKS